MTETARFTQDQEAARWPLIDAGNRILALLYRVSDQATDEQRSEHIRMHAHFCSIWNSALAERPIRSTRDD